MRNFVVLGTVLATLACGKPKTQAPPTLASFLPTLGTLVANPKAQKPASAKDDHTSTLYTYADAGTLKGLTLLVSKDKPGGWRMVFSTTEPVTAASFGEATGYVAGSSLPSDWYGITAGPLKGALVHQIGAGWMLLTAPFTLSRANSDGDLSVMRWACETGQAGVKAMAVGDFTTQCKDVARSKALLPDTADFHSLGINGEVRIEGDCNYAWHSDFTAKNAFGQEIKHNFNCSYTSKTNLVSTTVN